MKEITNETTYNRTVDMFLYTQKSNYLHKKIFFSCRRKLLQDELPQNWIREIQLEFVNKIIQATNKFSTF